VEEDILPAGFWRRASLRPSAPREILCLLF
jgi:hypothetical protein